MRTVGSVQLRRSRKQTFFSAALLCVLMLTACSEDDLTSRVRAEFAGDWGLSLTGDYTGGAYLIVNRSGHFYDPLLIEGDPRTYSVSGTIDNGGSLEGLIIQGSSQIGSLKGSMNHGGGSGTWQTNDGKSGNWTISPIFF